MGDQAPFPATVVTMRRGPLLPGPDDPICATPPRQAHWYELVGVAGKALCYMPIGKQVVRNNEHACGNHVAGHVHGGRISPYTHAWSGVRDRNLQVHVTHSITSSLGLHAHSAANAIYNKRRYPVPSRVQSSSAADARLLGTSPCQHILLAANPSKRATDGLSQFF